MPAGGDSLPPNFSWLLVNRIAGSGCPRSELELRGLLGVGVRYVVTLCDDPRPPPCIDSIRGLEHITIPVPDLRRGHLSDFDQFFGVCDRSMEEGGSILVHCRSGRGRTGMFLAAFLVKYQGLGADEAIRTVRSRRPGSIETGDQEQCLHDLVYYNLTHF